MRNFSPSDLICVDESISRWYGMGGHWINEGLPIYVAIDCKPENSCEIQDCCDARARVMLQLKLVKSKHDESNYIKSLEKDNGDKLNHGTKICL